MAGLGYSSFPLYDSKAPAQPYARVVDFRHYEWQLSDILIHGTTLYLAAGQRGIAFVPNVFSLAPQIDTANIETAADPNGALITGTAGAVTGEAPLTVALTNTVTGEVLAGVPVQADGSFTATLSATPGQDLTIIATDGQGRTAGPVGIDGLPIADAGSLDLPATATEFRARLLALNGNDLVVSDRPEGEYGGGQLAYVDVSDPVHPQYVGVYDITSPGIQDVAVKDGIAWVAANGRIEGIRLGNPMQVVATIDDNFFRHVAVIGHTLVSSNYGYINTYDISDPAAPRKILDNYWMAWEPIHDLIAWNDKLVVLLGNDRVEVRIVTLTEDPQVIYLGVNNFDSPEDGRVDGNKLYVSNRAGNVAVIDLLELEPSTVFDSGVFAAGIASRSPRIAIAAGAAGVRFFRNNGAIFDGAMSTRGQAWTLRQGRAALTTSPRTAASSRSSPASGRRFRRISPSSGPRRATCSSPANRVRLPAMRR